MGSVLGSGDLCLLDAAALMALFPNRVGESFDSNKERQTGFIGVHFNSQEPR